ncbi:MAG: SET domain-containing protein-lysine N-methyltransferase [Candidatus Uhrbacteria bacterium]
MLEWEKVYLKKSPINKQGVFANRQIEKDEVVFDFKGPIVKYPFYPNDYKGPCWLNFGYRIWGVPLNNTPWRFVNHSCCPNVGFGVPGQVVAMRQIKKDEEIVIDYSITEGTAKKWKLKCHCLAKNCRGIITSIQYLPQEIFDQQKKYIPKFLRDCFLAEKTYQKPKVKGLFAKRTIKRGEKIFTVEGPIINYPFPPNYRIGPTWVMVGKRSWIIPTNDSPCPAIKHSCNPNAGFIKKNIVVAMKTIKANQEITIDDSITEADPNWRKKCHCGEKNCRQIIRSIQYLPEKIYKKYLPFIPEYMQKVYIQKKGNKK